MFSFESSYIHLKTMSILICLVFFTGNLGAYAANPTFIARICPNTTSYSRNSTYFSNLRTVLTSLSSRNGPAYSTLFQNATAGTGNDTAYGLILCRGDVSPEVCRNCVVFSVNDTLQRCPTQKQALLWYDECMLRYSNKYIFSVMSPTPLWYKWNRREVSSIQSELFNEQLSSMMFTAAAEASVSAKRVSGKQSNFTMFQTMYGMVQCTTDISGQDCEICIRQAIGRLPDCCNGKVGGRVYSASCFIRYELYSFYNEAALAILAPAPPPKLILPPSPGAATPAQEKKKGGSSTALIIAIAVSVAASIVLFILGYYSFLVTRARKKYNSAPVDDGGNNEISTVDSLQIDFGKLEDATNKFSEENKLGEGGFGVVYKGTFPNGQHIAVKRLSKKSGQGAEEFKNEATLVAKLQHRNLARLLWFCVDGEEKILVYEFVSNKSLDYFLFDLEKQGLLDWSRRYRMIGGIARGILYLHQDSRLTIVHRDLKASNILLDEDMNPKISDFGIARIFKADQTQENTDRIIGTYGYMSPEYAMHGQFSMKSDVYSFGVLVLEIISSKKNRSLCEADGVGNLITYAWRLWREGTPLELLDPTMRDSYQRDEVIRCLHIGLLCIQEDPAARPTMANIVLMLNSHSVTLPVPRQPGFFACSRTEPEPPAEPISWSVDDASITKLQPR